MGSHDQSQVKIKFKKFEKKLSPFRMTYQKVITMTTACLLYSNLRVVLVDYSIT